MAAPSTPFPVSKTISDDLARVERALSLRVGETNGQLAAASLSILEAGGKRLRPMLVLISGQTGHYRLERLLPAAVAAEMIHMASLVHDDVLDEASERRGKPTVNAVWGENTAVETGDFLFAKAFEVIAQLEEPRLVEIMIAAAAALSLGEFDQMKASRNVRQPMSLYLERINKKTASLFSACCQSGCFLADGTPEEVEALSRYGQCLGMAFQILDDALDLSGGEKWGKTPGADIRDGTLTMPLLFALEELGHDGLLGEVLANLKPTDEQVSKALALISETDAVPRTLNEAHAYASKAVDSLAGLSSPQAREALTNISNFVINRKY